MGRVEGFWRSVWGRFEGFLGVATGSPKLEREMLRLD